MAKYSKNLAENLRRLVPTRFRSQAEFARAAGITQPQANQYINGEAAPKLDNLEGMAAALGVSISAMLGDEVPALSPVSGNLYERKLAAVSGVLRLDRIEDVETILEALEALLNRGSKKNQRRATGP